MFPAFTQISRAQVRCNYVRQATPHLTVSDARGVRFPHLVRQAFLDYGESPQLPPASTGIVALTVETIIDVDFTSDAAAIKCKDQLAKIEQAQKRSQNGTHMPSKTNQISSQQCT